MGKVIRRLLIAVLIAALVCGGIYGGLTFYRNSHRRAVPVYAVSEVITPAEYFFDESQAYGTISAERMQSVHLSGTQTVKEVLVTEGQEVKRGDQLFTYDTTLTSLQLEKEEIEVAQKELALKRLEEDMEKINRLVPSSDEDDYYGGDDYPDEEEEEEEPTPTPEPDETYDPQTTGVRISGDGTLESPYLYLWGESDALTNRTLLLMFTETGRRELEETYGEEEGTEIAEEALIWHRLGLLPYVVWGDVEEGIEDEAVYDADTEYGVEEGFEDSGEEILSDGDQEDAIREEDGETGDDTSSYVEEGIDAGPGDEEYFSTELNADLDPDYVEIGEEIGDEEGEDPSLGEEDPFEDQEPVSEIPIVIDEEETESDPEADYSWLLGTPNEVYVILETHAYDNLSAPLLQRYGLHLIRDGHQVAVRLFNPDRQTEEADSEPDEPVDGEESHTEEVEDGLGVDLPTGGVADFGDAYEDDYDGYGEDEGDDDREEGETPSLRESSIDFTAHYTAKEIEEMKLEQQKSIRDATIDYKMEVVNLKQMQAELGDGAVRSKLDGVIKTLRDPDDAYANGEAVVVVSGGGGYTVTISVGELELSTVAVGQEVSISSFNNESETHSGYIESISDYPTSDGDNWGMGNPFVSYYPCKVNITDEADFREGDYVAVKYNSLDDGGSNTFYLENMFIRSDSSGRYVYAANAEGKLERRNIVTGKVMDGYATEVRGGLGLNETIAFPYGTNLVEGAQTELASIDELYS